ncbi:hypothetical protein G647_03928 [Cladophialophora carrionii CBS 160.54]|uniref:Ubiquitin-like domain-containing protein n=1 Tax=Cladophialophora carrionii CBS 160.54 TaxID=1279043 RepID=V9DCD3_9EURO|nr:uncharacterized protein G647_03928 [Cladophialophora carrionii CBS 160.54]ETI24559.1 hypothetical protein G647_03928 [Cladophialophora carrionii CBS 160.54]
MGDLQSAKQFLTSLDNKTSKYQADHVFDPKTFQMRVPYVLPKLSTPPHPPPPKSAPTTAPAPGAEPATPTVTLILKSARNPHMTLTLPSIEPTTTTLQAIKEQIQSYLGGPSVVATEKIKLLWNKKPIPPSKRTIREALDGSDVVAKGGEVEIGVMVMGGAPDPPPQAQPPAHEASKGTATTATPAPTSEKTAGGEATPMEGVESTTEPVQPGGISGENVLETSEFWTDLQGFLEQRIRSSDEAVKLRAVFERAWRSSRTAP